MSSEKIFHNLTPLELALLNLVAYREGLSLYKANQDHLGYFTTEEENNTLSTLDHLESLAQVPNYAKATNAIGHIADHLIIEFKKGNIDRLCLAEFLSAFNASVGRINNILIDDLKSNIPGTSLEIALAKFQEETDRVVTFYERETHNLTLFEGTEFKGHNRKPIPPNVDLSNSIAIFYTDYLGDVSEFYLSRSQVEETVKELKKLQDDAGFDRWEANLIIN